MSAYAEHKHGAMPDEEFRAFGVEENNQDRWEQEHEYDEFLGEMEDEDE